MCLYKAKDFQAILGDIMIAMTGATTGKIGIVPVCDDNMVVNQRVGKFFLGKNPIEKAPFLFSTLIYDRVAYYLQPNGTAGSAQDNLSPDDIKRISIILPKDELIKNYNNKFKNLIKVIINNCAEIRALKKINNMLLIKYFTAENSDSSTFKLSFTLLDTLLIRLNLRNYKKITNYSLSSHKENYPNYITKSRAKMWLYNIENVKGIV